MIDVGNEYVLPPEDFKGLKILRLNGVKFAQKSKEEQFEVLEPYLFLATGTVRAINCIKSQKIDTAFFMDKSARPGAYLIRETWRNVFPDFHFPDTRFINIGYNSDHNSLVNEEIFEILKKRYGSMRGKNVAVFDDFVQTGRSIKKAKSIMESVFPESKSIIYGKLFDASPDWYDREEFIGVAEYRNREKKAPQYISKLYRVLEESEENPFIVYPLLDATHSVSRVVSKQALQARKDLQKMAKIIAQSVDKTEVSEVNNVTTAEVLPAYVNPAAKLT